MRRRPARRVRAWRALPLAVVGWLGLELAVRRIAHDELEAWAAPPPSGQATEHRFVGNPYLLYEYPPGRYTDGGVVVNVNDRGLRGPPVQVPKPATVRRFLTTGDSSIYGFGVGDDEVFSSVAAARLGPPVEAVCGAIPGYSTVQTLNFLHLRALAVEPDLLVIGNLWSDNNFDTFVDTELLATYAGYEASWTGWARRVLTASAVFRVLDWRLRVRERADLVRRAGWMVGTGSHGGRRRVAIADYAKNLDTLGRLATDRRAAVAFVLPAQRLDVEEAEGAPATPAWAPYREVMRDAAARFEAPLLDVPALFQASGLGADALFLDDMHPSAEGHRRMGEALAELLRDRGWPEGAPISGPGGGPVPTYEDPWVDLPTPPLPPGQVPDADAPPAEPTATAPPPQDPSRPPAPW